MSSKAPAATPAPAPMAASSEPKKMIHVVEEDDEFEEFEEKNWGAKMEEKESHIKLQWQDDWDVDQADDDFCNQLRRELEKNA
ncbi:hypothetical protein SPRG_19533 [Saprolegnia parasitica CBS 223.65]|uniref:26S proteasome complex subunit DSS1 n=1 Tax=Saprolegnia parasitica (strain CBS 223.65) TaxID=695850 RepID=A0A067CXL5_SAPPC|nr:hypothetical protein SPRG_19533 [Saprolegnia parasitica CBS 223.65]KDO31246.1 hypothetical protein SPRG_19533 [Saprolegnia parasitica CBS 223.65]|eukprot:XP_012198099.1 hypothetical protein SPRG_19533 [Saprolegnia parasitica CBS 223.65]